MRATSLDTLLQNAGFGPTLMPHLAIFRDVTLPKTLVARQLTGPNTSRRVWLMSRPVSPWRGMLDHLAP